jgi:hypothetical protein
MWREAESGQTYRAFLPGFFWGLFIFSEGRRRKRGPRWRDGRLFQQLAERYGPFDLHELDILAPFHRESIWTASFVSITQAHGFFRFWFRYLREPFLSLSASSSRAKASIRADLFKLPDPPASIILLDDPQASSS